MKGRGNDRDMRMGGMKGRGDEADGVSFD